MTKKDLGVLIFLGAVWGSSFIFIKLLTESYGFFFVASSRMMIAGIFLYLITVFKKQRLNIKENYKHYIISGFLNGVIPFIAFAIASKFISASLSVVINSLTPLITSFLAVIFLNEKLTRVQVIGLFISFLGIVLLALINGGLGDSSYILVGVLFALLACICYAANTIYVKLFVKNMNPISYTCGSSLFGGLLLLPFGIKEFTSFTPTTFISMLTLGILCTGIALTIFYKLINEIGSKAMITIFITPLFGILWGVLFLNESINFEIILASGVTIFGVYLFMKSLIVST